MSEIKSTPGPWLQEGRLVYASMHAGWRKGVELFKNRFWLHVDKDVECSEEEALANARLIAASPDLYRIVKQLQAIMGESQGIAGYHLNGEILTWADFDADGQIAAALAKTEEANV